MALIRMNFFSDALGMCQPATVILPQSVESGRKFPVLWLLHGMTGDHTSWTRYTGIERYAEKREICVVMPNAQLSRYRDMAHGAKFFRHIADELPRLMRQFFPLSEAREQNLIAGLSMGGAGAFLIGLSRPETFGAIGCLSAGLSNYMPSRLEEPGYLSGMRLVFGDRDPASEWDELFSLANGIVRDGRPAPRVYHACGTEDHLLEAARKTRDFFQSMPQNPFAYVYEEEAGAHTWSFWDAHILRFLDFALTKGGAQ